MTRARFLWLIAFIVTVAVAYYQRVTGPTYSLTGKTQLSGKEIQYKLLRSHGGESNAPVVIQTADSMVVGYLEWKRFKSRDPWSKVEMRYADGALTSELPHQPPAGKLQYRLTLLRGNEAAIIPAEEPVVIRFKGEVPLIVLVPHILAMFGSMLLAARAGLEYFNQQSNLKRITYWTMVLLFIGGFILGPLVQKYAFDAWWTGWPYGYDLTDNKTAIAFLAWIGVAFALKKSKKPKVWALVAAIVMFIVFLIPHSLLGSEIDYNAVDRPGLNVDSSAGH